MQKKEFRINLRVKLITLLLSLSIVCIAATAFMTFLSSEHYFKQSMTDSLEGLAAVKSQAIESFIKDRISQVEKIAVSPGIVSSVEKIIAEAKPTEVEKKAELPETTKVESEKKDEKAEKEGDDKKAGEGIFEKAALPEKEAAIKKEKVQENPEYQAVNKELVLITGGGEKYEELFILDPSGAVIVSTVYENEGKSAKNADFFASGLKTTFIQNIFVSEITKKLSMVISTPIKDESGKVEGVLGARLNLSTFYELIKGPIGSGKTGETVVGKKIGNEIVFMGPSRYVDNAALNLKIPAGADWGYPLQEAASGREGSGFDKNYLKNNVLAAWRYIPSLDWGLVAEMDRREALQPVIAVRNQIVIFVCGLILIVIILSSILSKGIVKSIQELTSAADSISKGNMDVKIDIKSKDEVGDLANSFERMLAAIRFLKEEKDAKK